MVRVMADGYLEGFISQPQIAYSDANVADVVPNVGVVAVVGERQCLLECTEGHVILRREEAAETDVVPHLSVVHAALHESSVESQRCFRLVCVEIKGSDLRNGLDR